MIDPTVLHNVLRRGVSEIIVEEEFVRLLQEGRPLRLKMGFDPSHPDIHLGHAVGLRKLRQLQDMGHQVVLIVGDWTAQIGDPSGQSVTRPMLTAEEVRANAETYMSQFFKVVDKERTQTMWQSEWFGNFTLSNVFDLTRRFTVAQFLARDDFAQRFRAQRPIAITELLYPLLQAYDSVTIESDVEFGGSDQRFNLLVGRDLQGMMGQSQRQCFIMPLLVGTDGVQKMSKSLNNYIGIDEPPYDMYRKVMSIPDALMMDYFELVTDVPDKELAEMRREMEAQSVNPMEFKKRLAREIVAQFHDAQAARQAEEAFEREVQRGDVPEEIPEQRVSFRNFPQEVMSETVIEENYTPVEAPEEVSVPFSSFRVEALRKRYTGKIVKVIPSEPDALNSFIVKDVAKTEYEYIHIYLSSSLVLLGLIPSISQAKQLIQRDSVEINGEKCADNWIIHNGDVLRIGRRRFVKIVNADAPQS